MSIFVSDAKGVCVQYVFKSHVPGSLRRLLIVTIVAAVSALTVAAAPSVAKAKAGGVDAGLEWLDISNTVLTSSGGPVGTEYYRAWAITWLAAARATNLDPAPGPARNYRTAAFASAVHESLVTLVPARSAELDQALATTLSRIPDGEAESAGVAAGQSTALDVLADRVGDGLGNASANPPYTPPPPGPGVWQPTPPGFVPGILAGLPDARPFSMSSADQFRPGPPPALGSAQYRADWTEVRDYGATNSTVRTAAQTQLAAFIYSSTPNYYQPAIREGVQELAGNLKRQAEFMATVRLAIIDTAIACWDAKYHYVQWRPITAIRQADIDGDPLTSADPTWTPLHITPPHPDYLSGHAGLMNAVVETLTEFTGPVADAPVTLTNPNLPGVTRTYQSWAQMNQDVIDARVWSGIHARTSDVVAAEVGGQIVQHIIDTSDQLFG